MMITTNASKTSSQVHKKFFHFALTYSAILIYPPLYLPTKVIPKKN